MDEDLTYSEGIPTTGPYRHLPPKPGEYDYLPPHRWLQLLRRGGVAFLYHPCADEEQVEELRTVARSCLNYYVMTPYPHMTKEMVRSMYSLFRRKKIETECLLLVWNCVGLFNVASGRSIVGMSLHHEVGRAKGDQTMA